MLLEQISMFSRIAKEQSISKAAQAIHISQPALSSRCSGWRRNWA